MCACQNQSNNTSDRATNTSGAKYNRIIQIAPDYRNAIKKLSSQDLSRYNYDQSIAHTFANTVDQGDDFIPLFVNEFSSQNPTCNLTQIFDKVQFSDSTSDAIHNSLSQVIETQVTQSIPSIEAELKKNIAQGKLASFKISPCEKKRDIFIIYLQMPNSDCFEWHNFCLFLNNLDIPMDMISNTQYFNEGEKVRAMGGGLLSEKEYYRCWGNNLSQVTSEDELFSLAAIPGAAILLDPNDVYEVVECNADYTIIKNSEGKHIYVSNTALFTL